MQLALVDDALGLAFGARQGVGFEQGYMANYQIVVDRVDNFDTIEVQVEMTKELFSDTVRGIAVRARELTEGLKSMLNINAKVTLLEPNTLPRSEGKAKRVIDKRKLHD